MIYYDNDSAKELFVIEKYISFDFSKMTVIETLSYDKHALFIEGLSALWTFNYTPYDSPNKECVKINYVNGDFDILCFKFAFSGAYDLNGNFKEPIGTSFGTPLKDLVNEMFEFKID